MYGIGYWESYDALVMDVSSDRNTITLRQDFAASLLAYDDYFGYYDGGFNSIFFDGKMFKKGEGPNIIADRDELDFGRCFVGGTVEKAIGIVNTGTEAAEYVVDVSSDELTIEIRAATSVLVNQLLSTLNSLLKRQNSLPVLLRYLLTMATRL